MGENEFSEIFGADFAEIAKAMDAAEAEHQAAQPAEPPAKDGLQYVNDGTDNSGHQISWYALRVGGKTLLWASVDNDLVVGNGPHGTTAHAIRIWNGARTIGETTKGLALRGPTSEGTRVLGQTVRSFVLPRALRWIAGFYGV